MHAPITLLICGSREMSHDMHLYACGVVDRAHTHGWLIIVGDATGIDLAVSHRCTQLGMAHTVVGGYGKIRGSYYSPKYCTLVKHAGDYLARDRYMVDHCDKAIGIWNGVSRGTRYTIDYALKSNKQAWLIDFSVKGDGNG